MALSIQEDEDLTQMLSVLEPMLLSLAGWDQGFIADQIERHKKYGSNISMSSKQWFQVRRIYDENCGKPDDNKSDLKDEIDDEIKY